MVWSCASPRRMLLASSHIWVSGWPRLGPRWACCHLMSTRWWATVNLCLKMIVSMLGIMVLICWIWLIMHHWSAERGVRTRGCPLEILSWKGSSALAWGMTSSSALSSRRIWATGRSALLIMRALLVVLIERRSSNQLDQGQICYSCLVRARFEPAYACNVS